MNKSKSRITKKQIDKLLEENEAFRAALEYAIGSMEHEGFCPAGDYENCGDCAALFLMEVVLSEYPENKK